MHELTGALSVAIVEVDPHIQQLLLAKIQDEGHYGVVYSSAEDFLDNASAQQFDLVLLDLMLPGVDGLTCLKRLQQNDAFTSPPRVVIVTALNDAEKKQEALSNGAEDYLLKPDLFERLPDLLHPPAAWLMSNVSNAVVREPSIKALCSRANVPFQAITSSRANAKPRPAPST